MTAPQTDAITDPQAVIAELRRERDAAFSERATMAEELATRDAALAQRNSEFGERIEYQVATGDVLKAMSASPGDAQPVLDLIVRRAAELCESRVGLFEFDGSMHHLRAMYGFEPDVVATYFRLFPQPLDLNGSHTYDRAVMERQIIHIRDIRADPVISGTVTTQMLDGSAVVSIPLLRDGLPIGVIGMNGSPPGGNGFSDSQVELLKTFAEQAVIAISSAETYRALHTRTADLQESLEYQTATSDVLKTISRAAYDLDTVLTMLLVTAERLCGANRGQIWRKDGETFRYAAGHNNVPAYREKEEQTEIRAGRGTLVGRVGLECRPVLIADAWNDSEYEDKEGARLAEARSMLGVPLLRDGVLIGAFALSRGAPVPFTDRQVDLVRTFADQAVIAMENARLLSDLQRRTADLQESLEYQTATSDVLKVISRSTFDLQPVLETVVATAARLCGTEVAAIFRRDGDLWRLATSFGFPPEYEAEWRAVGAVPLDLESQGVGWRAARERRPVHVHDSATVPGLRSGPIRQCKLRTALGVPLLREGEAVGTIVLGRQRVDPFTDRQIELVSTFADQAVIAIENTRLITEQREALEQQTATAEVLQVINASPGNLAPVFDIILEKAVRLCGVAFGLLDTWDGEALHTVATYGLPPAFAAYRAEKKVRHWLPPIVQRLVDTRRTIFIPDSMLGEGYIAGHPDPRALVDLGGARSTLLIPLVRDDRLLGYASLYRQEVHPFTDRQIALLENFAAQAVIAMENARLIDEQREALEQQTATAEVLQVINSSPGNLAPVFDAILEKAVRLCQSAFGTLFTYDGQLIHFVAAYGITPEMMNLFREPRPPAKGAPTGRIADGEPFVHVADATDQDIYRAGHRQTVAFVDQIGARTALFVGLRRDATLLGYLVIFRREVHAFSDKEIALLQNFAAQAVIAIENARLLNEIRQRQAELRVTFENMGDGVAMFDETPRLIAWNRRFQDILDVPDDAMEARRTFDEYIRYLTERGEFGPNADPDEQVLRLHATRGQAAVFERARPNGRIIEVRRNPIPSGGFVLIYSDITERKRNEAEIRAARDAAEEASRTIEAAFRELKAAQANLIQAEKMASLGQLTAGIAHEIKNPLNFVNNFAILSVELLNELKETIAEALTSLDDDQRADVEGVVGMLTSNLEKITEHGKRADGIVKAMLEHSRGASGERRMVDLNTLAAEALNLAYHGARAHDQSFSITLECDFGDRIAPIEVNPQDMTRVFLNLFSNGFYAANKRARSSAGPEFEPMLTITTRDLGGAAEVRVRDNGTGIPAEIRDKLFQPFFTTKPTGEGTGLGLSITYDIVTKQHGGTITVDSEVDAFTEFVVTLPRRMFTNGGSRA